MTEVGYLAVSGMILPLLFGFLFNGTSKQLNPCRHVTSVECLASFDDHAAPLPFGLRVDARTLTLADFQRYLDGKRPVILTNVFDIKSDDWTNDVMKSLGDNEIEYDVRNSLDGSIESYQAKLADFISSLGENSDHEENMYLMNEDLLRNETKLLDFLKSARTLFGDDLFEHFPAKIRPYQALIMGGIGARSFLHCDPYEWMGINYLFEGRKLWTFLSPDVPSSLFNARRNPPDAWGAYNISAGWVSDVDLYRHRQNFGLGALANAEIKRQNSGKKGTSGDLQKIASSSLNGKWLRAALGGAGGADEMRSSRSDETKQATFNNLDVPIFMSGDITVDYCEDPRFVAGAQQFIQEEGDLVLIPPRYWHQVYHLEPSIAIASQYVNTIGKDRTFNHILRWCSGGDESDSDDVSESSVSDVSALRSKLPKDFDTQSDKDQIMTVIKTGLKIQHGLIKGSALMKKLLRDV